ncbi:MAG TPA: hypothetical protein VM204_09180 [Gaiellaceae bacterium]|nr:hypothetical protein [Gaiellaceae bacterium]
MTARSLPWPLLRRWYAVKWAVRAIVRCSWRGHAWLDIGPDELGCARCGETCSTLRGRT